MGVIGSILLVLVLGDCLWWWRADRVLRRLQGGAPWRIVLGTVYGCPDCGARVRASESQV